MARPAAKDPNTPVRFETAMAELEKIVAAMEAGQLTLEASLEHYRRGAELLALCQGQLKAVEDQVRVLEDGVLRPFALDAAGARLHAGARAAGDPAADDGADAGDDDDGGDGDDDGDDGAPAGRRR